MECLSCEQQFKDQAGHRPLKLKCKHLVCEECFKDSKCAICGVESDGPVDEYLAQNILQHVREAAIMKQEASVSTFHCKNHPRREVEHYCRLHKEMLCTGCAFHHMNHKDSVVIYSYENLCSDVEVLHHAIENFKNECNERQKALNAVREGKCHEIPVLEETIEFCAKHGNADFLTSFPKVWSGIEFSSLLNLKDIDGIFNHFKKKRFDLQLLYRGSRDGFEPQKFHEKCDDKGATLSVISATSVNDKAKKITVGGYTATPWTSKGGGKPARLDDFIFLLDPLTVLKPEPNCVNGTLHNSNYGTNFGTADIEVSSNKKLMCKHDYYKTPITGNVANFPYGEFVIEQIEVFAVS